MFVCLVFSLSSSLLIGDDDDDDGGNSRLEIIGFPSFFFRSLSRAHLLSSFFQIKSKHTKPQNLIFRFLQSRQTVQIWLYEQADLRIEGRIIVRRDFFLLLRVELRLLSSFFWLCYRTRHAFCVVERVLSASGTTLMHAGRGAESRWSLRGSRFFLKKATPIGGNRFFFFLFFSFFFSFSTFSTLSTFSLAPPFHPTQTKKIKQIPKKLPRASTST